MVDTPPTPLGNGPTSAPNAEIVAAFTNRAKRGTARMDTVCHLLQAQPGLAMSLRQAPDPYERLAGALIEIGCALRRGDVAPPGGWGPEESHAVAGLFAELWGANDSSGAVFAAHHTLHVTRAARADLEVFEGAVRDAGLQVPSRQRGWPNGEVLTRIDTTLRAPLSEATMAALEARLAVLSGWVSLGGGNKLLKALLNSGPSQRSIAVCCYALFSAPTKVSPDAAAHAKRDVLRLLGTGDIVGALAAAHRLTSIPVL